MTEPSLPTGGPPHPAMRDQTVRDIAVVTVTEAVPNRVPRKRKEHGHKPRNGTVEQITVVPEVMEAAKALVRPGITRLEIVSAECVKVVNICPANRRVAHKASPKSKRKSRKAAPSTPAA